MTNQKGIIKGIIMAFILLIFAFAIFNISNAQVNNKNYNETIKTSSKSGYLMESIESLNSIIENQKAEIEANK